MGRNIPHNALNCQGNMVVCVLHTGNPNMRTFSLPRRLFLLRLPPLKLPLDGFPDQIDHLLVRPQQPTDPLEHSCAETYVRRFYVERRPPHTRWHYPTSLHFPNFPVDHIDGTAY